MMRNDRHFQGSDNSVLSWSNSIYRFKDAYSVSGAITHLRNYLDFPRSVSQALAVLKQLDCNSSLCRLYRRYFPQEWAGSTAGMRARPNEGYTPREIEFLRLVERHLFPLDCDYMLDMAAEGARTESILVLPYATRWDDEPQEMNQEWQLLLIVSDSIHSDEALNLLFDMEETIEPPLYHAIKCAICDTQSYSRERLEQICAEITGPLAHLALTFSLMFYDTGNEWLDAHGDDGTAPFDYVPLRWCEQHIDVLCRTFREAQEMEQRTEILADWLRASPNSHMRSVLDLLERAKT